MIGRVTNLSDFVCNNQPTANKADGQSEKKRFYLNLL